MKLKITENYNTVVIAMEGNVIGGPKADIFRHELHDLILAEKLNIIVDLSKVSFMNSNGLGILIGGLTSMKNAGGNLILCGATKNIKSLLLVSQLNKIFENYDTLDEAIEFYN